METLTFEHIKELFLETREQMKETDRQMKETDRKFQESVIESEKRNKELDKKFEQVAKRMNDIQGLFTTQWGKLIEALVEPSCLRLFRERGIKIEESYPNVKIQRNDTEAEYDILLVNGTELVVVEVKTTFKPEYADEFLEKLQAFKTMMPKYADYTVYGAVAAIKYEAQSDKYAYRNGLFVLKSSDAGIIKISNDKKFKPQSF